MTYLGVSELKKSRELWAILDREKEIVLTRDGKPGAVMLQVTPSTVESVRRAIRNALFAAALADIRSREAERPISEAEIDAEIRAVRRVRRRKAR